MNYDEGIEKILRGLEEYSGFYSRDYYMDFESKASGMKEKIQDSLEEGRVLKIGIVGEIKAGKSSFLNSMIFDGEDILPKASTPMTAALTKIQYSETDKAKIVFYNEKDWDKVKDYANEYEAYLDKEYNEYCSRMSEQNMMRTNQIEIQTREAYKAMCHENIPVHLRSCKELVDMANKSEIDIEEWLGKDKTINCTNLAKELDDYIGAEGNYTAIVKHVELGMNNELLQGIEIIDTPGMNDPIVSRGETTKKFLQNCDVVFLLSYSGQFLTQEDISFMAETLPREGVKNIVIIGSKLDSGVLDNSKFKEFPKAVAYSKQLYDKQATENISKCLKAGNNREIVEKIQESLPPLYVSSLMYDVARKNKNGIPLEKYEINILNQCKSRFEGFSEDEKFLLKLSGIDKVRSKKLREIKEQKDEIIADKNRTIVQDSKKMLMNIISQIRIQTGDNYLKVRNGDIEKLEKQLRSMQSNLGRMRYNVKNIFEKYGLEAVKILKNMESEIDLEINNHVSISIQESQHTEYRKEKTGIFKYEVFTENVITKSASISDVISNLRNYVARCIAMSNDTLSKAININKLKNEIKDVLLAAFEAANHEFNENDILIPLDIVVGRISIPYIEVDMDEYESMIIDSFSDASVSGQEIDDLKLRQNTTMTKIAKRLKQEIKKCATNIEIIMADQANGFVDSIINTLNENIQIIKGQIENKEKSMKQYETLDKLLIEYVSIIKEMEM